MRSELLRKAVHILLALVFIVLGLTFGPTLTALMAGALFLGFLAARLIQWLRIFHDVPRTSYGELFFSVGVALTALLILPISPAAYTAALLVLGVSDPLAALVGTRYGTHAFRLRGERKTFEGSMAMGISAAGILLFLGMPFLLALSGGLILMVLEVVALRGSDNLILPLATGLFAILV